jgi:hypothetical protein
MEATTNLDEVTCDFINLWDSSESRHREVRELFVAKASVLPALEEEVPMPGGETETALYYPEDATDEQVPGLRSLVRYIDLKAADTGTINKYFTLHRKYHTIVDGSLQLRRPKGAPGARGRSGFG